MIVTDLFESVPEQGMAEGHGNYAGDTPVNLGGVSMKMIQAGDTVKYIDQQAQVVDMSQDRKYSRITIPSSSTTKTVLTSDLRSLGQGMAEGSEESYMIIRTDAEGKKDVFAGNFDTYEQAQKELDACLAHPLHTKYKQKFEIKRKGQQGVSEADDEQLDEFNLKDLGSKIFGSRPNTNANAAPGSLSPPSSAYIPNPATGKPYTQAEIRALAAQKAAAAKAAASTEPAAPTPPAAPQPIRIGKDIIYPNDPMYNIIMKNANTSLAETVAQVRNMMESVETKEDIQKIKVYIDRQFTKHGLVSETAFAQRDHLIERVVQFGAQRRRDFAAQQAH